MKYWQQKDTDYWLTKEDEIRDGLINLADSGFIIAERSEIDSRGNEDPCLIRPGVARALEKARDTLPDGNNFIIYDAWRPWERQRKAAENAERKIREAHPDWDDRQISDKIWVMAPPVRVLNKFGSHRYAGAVDLSIAGSDGNELDMGVPVSYVTGPEAQLLFYEFPDTPSALQLVARDNRRLLISAMQKAVFYPYLEEFWHWSYQEDMAPERT